MRVLFFLHFLVVIRPLLLGAHLIALVIIILHHSLRWSLLTQPPRCPLAVHHHPPLAVGEVAFALLAVGPLPIIVSLRRTIDGAAVGGGWGGDAASNKVESREAFEGDAAAGRSKDRGALCVRHLASDEVIGKGLLLGDDEVALGAKKAVGCWGHRKVADAAVVPIAQNDTARFVIVNRTALPHAAAADANLPHKL